MSKAQFRVEAVLPAPAHSYFLERDSAAFRSLLSKVLKIGQLEFKDIWREGTSSFVRIVTKPEFGSWVPKGVAAQLQSSNLEFHDIIEYSPAHIASPPYRIFVRTESPFLKEKLDVRMTLTIEEVDGGAACRQVLEGHIRVKMFGVGRIVEGIVKDSLINTYKKLPEIVRRWQVFREEALQSGDGRQLLLGRPPVGCEVSWIRQEVLQILKEPLPHNVDGSSSPISALCQVAGASEASDDSPATRQQQRLQHQLQAAAAAAAQRASAVESAFAAAAQQEPAAEGDAAEQQRQGMADGWEVSAEDALVQLPRRDASLAYSTVSQYYDAQEAPEDEAVSESPHRQQSQLLEAGTAGAAQQQQQQQAAMPSAPGRLPTIADSEALPPGLDAQPSSAAALAALARNAVHRRGISGESATSTDTPGEEGDAMRRPGSRRFWRRFNRDYSEWEVYWDEVGVEQEGVGGEEAAEEQGVVTRALHAAEGLLRSSYYSTSILVALFLMRHGWLCVEPDANADPHLEPHHSRHPSRQRMHYHHSRNNSSTSASGGGGPSGAAPLMRPQPHSLAQVAQEVCSRMVSGTRTVAKAPVKVVVAAGNGLATAGTTMRQASVTGAKAIFKPKSLASLRTSSDAEGSRSAHISAAPVAAALGVAIASGSPTSSPQRQRKTMSLDTGTAAACRQAALQQQAAMQQQQQQGGGARPPLTASTMERRPSDLAAVAAMASMQRNEGRVRASSRLSCFTICRRPPAVKD